MANLTETSELSISRDGVIENQKPKALHDYILDYATNNRYIEVLTDSVKWYGENGYPEIAERSALRLQTHLATRDHILDCIKLIIEIEAGSLAIGGLLS